MMEWHEFCDECKGCRPAMAKIKKGPDGKPLVNESGLMETDGNVPDDDPMMVVINHLWDNDTTYAQRRSYIEVTLHNSRNVVDLQRFQEVSQMMQSALAKMVENDA